MRCLATALDISARTASGIRVLKAKQARRPIPHRDGQKWSYLKALWVVAQHIKARCEDHRLNRIGDAIVIRCRPVSATALGGIA
jgi:hypothetical protein